MAYNSIWVRVVDYAIEFKQVPAIFEELFELCPPDLTEEEWILELYRSLAEAESNFKLNKQKKSEQKAMKDGIISPKLTIEIAREDMWFDFWGPMLRIGIVQKADCALPLKQLAEFITQSYVKYFASCDKPVPLHVPT